MPPPVLSSAFPGRNRGDAGDAERLEVKDVVVEGADGDAEELGNRLDAVVRVGQQVAGLTQQVGVDGVGAPSDAAAGPRGGEINA